MTTTAWQLDAHQLELVTLLAWHQGNFQIPLQVGNVGNLWRLNYVQIVLFASALMTSCDTHLVMWIIQSHHVRRGFNFRKCNNCPETIHSNTQTFLQFGKSQTCFFITGTLRKRYEIQSWARYPVISQLQSKVQNVNMPCTKAPNLRSFQNGIHPIIVWPKTTRQPFRCACQSSLDSVVAHQTVTVSCLVAKRPLCTVKVTVIRSSKLFIYTIHCARLSYFCKCTCIG